MACQPAIVKDYLNVVQFNLKATGMGRRSAPSRDDLRAMILEAARAILATDGLRGLTARRVAKAIGYSPGTLYNFFTNIDELILHIAHYAGWPAASLGNSVARKLRAERDQQPDGGS